MRIGIASRCLFVVVLLAAIPARAAPANPVIDAPGFVAIVDEATRHRESRRIDEDTFVRLMSEPGTVVLDARSRPMYDRRHVEGAVSLSFPDFTTDALARVIPSRATRVLIYCNNNFRGDPVAFALKSPEAALNLSTYVALYTYGYRNVYELAPYVDVSTTSIPLVPRPARVAR
jgi:phage shock protein E